MRKPYGSGSNPASAVPFFHSQTIYTDTNRYVEVVTDLITITENDYREFAKCAEPKIKEFIKNKYRLKATGRPENERNIVTSMDGENGWLNFGYTLFLKEIYDLEFPKKIVKYLEQKGFLKIETVSQEDWSLLFQNMKSGVHWDNTQFTTICAEKPKTSTVVCIPLLIIEGKGKEAKPKLAPWIKILPPLRDP